MYRRDFLTLIGSSAGCLFALGAQRSLPAEEIRGAKIREVGFFYPGTAEASKVRVAAFLKGLKEKGYVEGQNVALVTRITELRPDKLAPLALELVHRKVDVILGIGSPAVLAARAATSSIPIVALDLESDPVNRGFVSSLSRPGGNITGLFFDFPEFSGKWFELLEEVLPGLAHVTILWDPATDTPQLGGVNAVATARRIALELLRVETLTQMEDAFRAAAESRTQAVMLLSSPLIGANLKLAASLALQYRLPAITMFPEFAEVGGLMGYGTDLMHLYQQAGALVGKILSGARPADIPVERPTRFQFVINLKTANVLGLTIPPTLLIRADEVIEGLG